ncbi:hypothetical protein [Streptomyces flaveolus]|uniref:hypothetical protein n=1 Tax=Streptomyces flaveolus TaxID=67297 RepID=UPI003D9ED1E4
MHAAMSAGKSVLCEWPLGNGLAEAEDMAQQARGHGVSTVVGLPPEGLRRPVAFVTHRLTAQLPPHPRSAPGQPHHHLATALRNCDGCHGCDRGFRAPETEPHCRDCRTPAVKRSLTPVRHPDASYAAPAGRGAGRSRSRRRAVRRSRFRCGGPGSARR